MKGRANRVKESLSPVGCSSGSSAGLKSGIKASDLYSKISLNYKKASPPFILEEWPRRKLKVTPFLFLSKLSAVKADAGDYAFVVFQIPRERYLLSIWRNVKNVVPRPLRVSEHLLQVRD
jgi:hypothetical protein